MNNQIINLHRRFNELKGKKSLMSSDEYRIELCKLKQELKQEMANEMEIEYHENNIINYAKSIIEMF